MLLFDEVSLATVSQDQPDGRKKDVVCFKSVYVVVIE